MAKAGQQLSVLSSAILLEATQQLSQLSSTLKTKTRARPLLSLYGGHAQQFRQYNWKIGKFYI